MSNTRFITAIVAFVATFIFSAGLVRVIFPAPVVQYVYVNRPQYIERNTNAIESFILRDITNGENRMDRMSYSDSKFDAEYADAVMDYVNTSSSMDASRFPQDFQNAWREHMRAWRNYAEFLEDLKNPAARKNLTDTDFRKAEKNYNDEINRTWEIVLQFGRNYGANVN